MAQRPQASALPRVRRDGGAQVTREEKERLLRHEEWISRPVRELFPRAEAKTYNVICRGCKVPFTYTR